MQIIARARPLFIIAITCIIPGKLSVISGFILTIGDFLLVCGPYRSLLGNHNLTEWKSKNITNSNKNTELLAVIKMHILSSDINYIK